MGGDESSNAPNQETVAENKEKRDEEITEMTTTRGGIPPAEMSIENFDANLPKTVSLLHGPNGAKVYLVGTAHFSLESQEDVSNVIRTVRPQIVVIEVCKGRSSILKMDEKTIEEEVCNLSLAKMKEIVKENGVVQGMMNILLLRLSAQLTRDLGMAPGGEFRRAFQEVMRLPGCLLHYGDRPIQITLNRALSVLSWWQRLRLSWSFLFRSHSVTKKDVEQFKESDLLASMLKHMSSEFPELGKVFIEERDMYLTYSLQTAASCTFFNHLNVRERTVAVGIVGIGHTPGIKNLWGTVTEDHIRHVMIVEPEKNRGILKKTLGLGLLLLVGYKLRRRLYLGSLLSQLTQRFRG